MINLRIHSSKTILGLILVCLLVSASSFHHHTVFVASQTFSYEESASGGTTPTVEKRFIGITSDNSNNIYVSTYANPATLAKFVAAPLALTLNVDTTTSVCNTLTYYSSYLYVACSPSSGVGIVLRRNAADLSDAGVMTRSEPLLNNMFVFDPYLYVVSAASPSVLIRIYVANFTFESALELTGIDAVHGALITSNGSHFYGATDDVPISVIKMDRIVWDRFYMEQVALNAGEDGMNRGIAEDGTYLYLATTSASPGLIVKVAMSSLTRVTALALDSAAGEDELHDIHVDRFTGYAYVTVYFSNPARIVRVWTIGSMSRTDAIDAANSNNPEQIIMLNAKLYVTAAGSSGSVPDVVLKLGAATTSTTTTTTTTSTTTTTATTTLPPTTTPTPSTTSTTTTTTTPTPTTTTSTTTTVPTTTTSTSATSTTASTTTTATTTTTTVTPSPPFGQDDQSLALAGSSTVAIAAGISAGAGIFILIILLCVISRKDKKSSSDKKLSRNDAGNDSTSNTTNNSVRQQQQQNQQHQGTHVEVGHDDVFQDDHDTSNHVVEMQNIVFSRNNNNNNDLRGDDVNEEHDTSLREFRKSNEDSLASMPPLDADAQNERGVPKWRNSSSGLHESGMM